MNQSVTSTSRAGRGKKESGDVCARLVVYFWKREDSSEDSFTAHKALFPPQTTERALASESQHHRTDHSSRVVLRVYMLIAANSD